MSRRSAGIMTCILTPLVTGANPPRERTRPCDRICHPEAEGTNLAATILNGTKIAGEIRAEVAAEVKALSAEGLHPGLAVILAGNNQASEIYVRGKVKACEEVGIRSE